MSLVLRSPAFDHGGEIPRLYTCEGEDVSPPLEWTGVPDRAISLALLVEDPDAPDPSHPKGTWVHWVLYNLSPSLNGLPASLDHAPGTSVAGSNDWNRTGYGGPCPPVGRHRYFFKLFALDVRLALPQPASSRDVEAAMRGHVLATAELVGTYRRAQR